MTPAHSAAMSARPASLAFGVVMGFLPVEDAPDYTTDGTVFQITPAGVPDHEDAVYDPALLSRRFCLPTNVRLWLLADIHPHSDLRPLYPRKQT